jgi:MFS family permease
VTAAPFYGWKLLGAFWLIACFNLAFPAYGSSVLNAAMASSLGFDRQTLGTMVAIYLAMSGLPGPLVAFGVNRIGVRWTLVIGSGLIVIGAVMLATVVSTGTLAIIAFGFFVGAGVATGAIIAAQAGVARWFMRRRALALSLLYSGGAIGGFVAPPLLTAVAAPGGLNWRFGWWVIAALAVVAAAIAILFVREHPADIGQAVDGVGLQPDASAAPRVASAHRVPAFVTRDEWSYREALRGPLFWMMIWPFIGVSAGFALFLAHGVVHLRDLGHSMQVGAWAVGTLTISGLAAKAILGALGDRIDPRFLWAVFCASFGVGLILLVDARAPFAVTLAAICMGIGFGGGIVAMMATLSNYYGTRAFASLSGLAIAINTGICAIAPVLAGRMYDSGAGYALAFYAVAVWCIGGAVLLALLRRPRHRNARIAEPLPEAPA